MKQLTGIAAVTAMSLALIACGPKPDTDATVATETTPPAAEPATPATPPVSATPPAKDDSKTDFTKWFGKWQGQEGTYIKIDPADGGYQIELANLDGPKMYHGTAKGDHIEFVRDGRVESIIATDGEGTGMKYLGDKKNCLVVAVGAEGFCRD